MEPFKHNNVNLKNLGKRQENIIFEEEIQIRALMEFWMCERIVYLNVFTFKYIIPPKAGWENTSRIVRGDAQYRRRFRIFPRADDDKQPIGD